MRGAVQALPPMLVRRRPSDPHVTDWASVGTAVGTLVLAGATFAAVRSGNRSARIAERTLLAGLRPVLVPGPRDDRGEQVLFADGRALEVGGGRATVEEADGVVYLALPLANVGSGLALLLGYRLESQTAEQTRDDPLGPARHRRGDAAPDPSTFRRSSATSTSPPGASASGRRRFAIPPTSSTRPRSRRSAPAAESPSIFSTATTKAASRRSPVRAAPRRARLALRRDSPLEPRPRNRREHLAKHVLTRLTAGRSFS